MSNYMETYKQWCTDPYFDADTKAELRRSRGIRQRSRIVFTDS